MLRMSKVLKTVLQAVLMTAFLMTAGGSRAYARVEISRIDAAPPVLYGLQTEACAHGDAETPPQTAVEAEINHLEDLFPRLGNLDINVNIVRQRGNYPGIGMLAGCTAVDGSAVYLFASTRYVSRTVRWPKTSPNTQYFGTYLASYAVAHELGHAVRCKLVPGRSLLDYLKFRSNGKAGSTGWANDPEEIFAEDFRWLFGSRTARQIPYLCSLKPPGEKEKKFLMQILAGL
jgi:hypothetical protein